MNKQAIITAAPQTQTTGEILKTRARALARPPVADEAQQDVLEVVEFVLAKERYALEYKFVREVFPLRELTPLPCTPGFVVGLTNVRGQVLPVIDIKKFFDLPDAGITDLHSIIIIQYQDVELGVLADAVATVQRIPLRDIQPCLPTLTGIRAQYLKGVAQGTLVILDAQKLLTDPKTIINEQVEI